MVAKKRCCVCRKMFRPDPRVGDRQRACGEVGCQRHRRSRTQASWRSRNPAYQCAYRLEKRAATDEAAARDRAKGADRPVDPPPLLRVPAALAPFPWDFARAKLGLAGADLLATLALRLVRRVPAVKDQRLGETALLMGVYAPVGRDP